MKDLLLLSVLIISTLIFFHLRGEINALQMQTILTINLNQCGSPHEVGKTELTRLTPHVVYNTSKKTVKSVEKFLFDFRELKIEDMNENLVILMFKYDKLDKSFNFLQQSYNNLGIRSSKSTLKKKRDFHLQSLRITGIHPEGGNRAMNLERDSESQKSNDFKNQTIEIKRKSRHALQKSECYDPKSAYRKERLRVRRSSKTFRNGNIMDKNLWFDKDKMGGNRTTKNQRENGRGKKGRKNEYERRPKRGRRRLGPLIATFVGAQPEQHVTDSVYIGPWVKSSRNESHYTFNKFHLVEDKKSIEVTTDGLYMVLTQIFYFGDATHYSYWILVNSEGASVTQKLAKCATASPISDTEVSCHTSVMTPLKKGDRVRVQQQEQNRWMYDFICIIRKILEIINEKHNVYE